MDPGPLATYIGQWTFFTIIYIRDGGFSLRYVVVIQDIVGQQTFFYTMRENELIM